MTELDLSQNGADSPEDNDAVGRILNAYRSTNHSYASVRGGQRFINWNTQPSSFKKYPKFYRRIGFDSLVSAVSFLPHIGSVNFEKKYGSDTYKLRYNPSAGALYPNEIYIQSRGIEGLEDGIYHYEVASSSLVFLAPVSAGFGLEFFCEDKKEVRGLLFVVSAAYFRSSWKYENRSIRYCFLDAGHILGGIEAAVQLSGGEVLFDISFARSSMDEFFGFENKEYTVAAAMVGKRVERQIAKPPFVLPFVSPYDYFEQNLFVESFLDDESEKPSFDPQIYQYKTGLLSTSLLSQRRSIRGYFGKTVSADEYADILGVFSNKYMDVYSVVNLVDGAEQGLYIGGKSIKTGDFSKKAGYLCLEQALGSDSAVTFFIAAKGGANIKNALLEAGLSAHRVYLVAQHLGIGVSGIGAYYDEETAEFLGIDKNTAILYALSIGR